MSTMVKYIVKRILWVIPVIICVAILIFTIMYFTPGDPVLQVVGTNVTPEQLDEIRHEMGLDQPYLVQLKNYLVDTFIKRDFGTSWMTNQNVLAQIKTRLPYTLLIGLLSVLVAIIVGIPLGIVAATNQYNWKDSLAIFVSLFCVSMPQFWFALILVMFFALKLGLLPAVGIKTWTGYVLPVVASSVGAIANIARQTRSSMLEVIRQDYITTARAKGQKERNVIYRHALRNALNPVITIIGSIIAGVLGGTMVIEQIFSIPGIGSFLLTAISARDYPVVRGSVLVISVMFCLCMLVVDILYVIVNPRLANELK